MFSEKVTIVIPVYNRVVYLRDTIASVLRQIYPHWELVVVDDGSVEEVRSVVNEFADTRISYVHQANQGNAVARNTGIGSGTGEFVICLDSDDIWHPTMLQTCVSRLRTSPEIDVVYTQFLCIDARGAVLPFPAQPEARNGDLLKDLLLAFPILPSSAMVRRMCFDRWGLYAAGLDDWEMWLRWAVRGCKFFCIEETLLFYRLHDQNLNWDWRARRRAHFDMLDRFYAQGDLPPVAIQMKSDAIVQQHYHFTLLAWRLGRTEDGIAEFICLAKQAPRLLHDLSFYTTLACAHQDRLDHGTPRNLDLEKSRNSLIMSLDGLFAQPVLPIAIEVQRSQAYASAYLALGRLAYGVAHDMHRARLFFFRSLLAWFPVLWASDWLAWSMRSIIEFERLQHIKGLMGLRPGQASDNIQAK